MMNVFNLLVSPVIEIVKSSAPPLKRQICYYVHYKKKVEELGKKIEDLKNVRTDVQYRVDAAKKKLDLIRKVVEAWLEKVNVETTRYEILMRLMNGGAEVEMIENQCYKGWSHHQTRYNIGREAQKKMVIIDELLSEGKSFTDVSDRSTNPLGVAYYLPPNGSYEAYESREFTKNRVLASLKDKTTYLIGVYGMGGVGKTTLMGQVAKLVIEEEIFNTVVMITVSHNVELKKIQDEIAKKLDFKHHLDEVDDEPTRAAMLYARLEKESSFLVILDDLWSNLDLNDVGIPCENLNDVDIASANHPYEGKVVIVSRSLDVCNSYCSQSNIEVGVLGHNDSWKLFKKNAGDIVDSPSLQTVAKEVAKECGCLPIALVTLGRALRNKEKLVWEDTALQLKRSNFTYIEGMNSKVFSSIRLSYDHLQNEIVKKMFLLCCLYPEDCPIIPDEMVMYIMADELILEDLETLKHARGRLNTVLGKLMASCMLLGEKKNDGEVSYVLMHDLIRDVAISIASEDENGFFVKAGMGLRNWPESRRLLSGSSQCLRLSLIKNEISVLPDRPEFPHLLSLSLEGNKPLNNMIDLPSELRIL